MNADPKSIIRLDDFLKRSGLVGTGGEAKLHIQSGQVVVNGDVETRRRKQLAIGDVVEMMGQKLVVAPFDE
jgi:ribosome-associated protein